jgi:ABC-type multidrug transport system ATPase subunit
MEECEALSQRIGIMVSGSLRCIGTASRLRSRYGQGYQLDVNVEPTKVAITTKWIQRQFIGSAILESHGRTIKFRLTKVQSLASIFR